MVSTEMRGFVVSVVFIVAFASFMGTMPAGFQGPAETPDDIGVIDPNLVSGFEEQENYTRAAFTNYKYVYPHKLPSPPAANGREYIASDGITQIYLSAKRYFWLFWFGAVDYCRFIHSNGDRGLSLQLTEITADADEGSVTYGLRFGNSASAGSLVCWWNTTEYANATLAWDSNELYLVHGVGFAETATADIGALVLGLLFLQLPDVPFLVNLFITIPIWACIGFVVWYIIKEMIPFN